MLEEFKIVFVEKYDFKNLDVVIDNNFVIPGPSRSGSEENTYALWAQC